MNNNLHRSPQHRHLRLAKALLLVTSIILLIANVGLMKETRQLARSYSEQQNQATWFLFQLNKELSELVAESSRLNDKQPLADLIVQYEIAWSRFDLMLTSRESDSFMMIAEAREFFEMTFEEFKSLEPLLMALPSQDLTQSNVFHDQVNTLYLKMIDYVNRNFRVKSPLYQQQQATAQELQSLQLKLLFGFVFCLALISVVFHKEARYNHKLAMTDTLTRLGNRLALFINMNALRSSRNPFTLYLLDLDGFKAVNDKLGHQEGDRALFGFAQHIKGLEGNDFQAYRMGGDEFAIVHRNGHEDTVVEVLDYIDMSYRGRSNESVGRGRLSVSVGMAHFPQDASSLDELLSVADQRMYEMKFCSKQDKQTGKKQV